MWRAQSGPRRTESVPRRRLTLLLTAPWEPFSGNTHTWLRPRFCSRKNRGQGELEHTASHFKCLGDLLSRGPVRDASASKDCGGWESVSNAEGLRWSPPFSWLCFVTMCLLFGVHFQQLKKTSFVFEYFIFKYLTFPLKSNFYYIPGPIPCTPPHPTPNKKYSVSEMEGQGLISWNLTGVQFTAAFSLHIKPHQLPPRERGGPHAPDPSVH